MGWIWNCCWEKKTTNKKPRKKKERNQQQNKQQKTEKVETKDAYIQYMITMDILCGFFSIDKQKKNEKNIPPT